MTGDDGVDDTRTVRIPIGEFIDGFPIDENFDGSPTIPTGWTTFAEGAAQPWKITTQFSSSPPRTALGDSASNPGRAVLESPAIVIGDQGAYIEFRHRYDLETYRYDPELEDQDEELIVDAADGAVLEVSLDGGEWVDLLEYPGVVVLEGGYTHTVVEDFLSPIAGRRAWSGDSGGFIVTGLQLPTELAFNVARFRWISASDYSYQEDGWYVDDIIVDSLVSQCKPFYPALSLEANGDSLSEGGASLTGTLSTPLPLIQPMSVTLETSGTADPSDLTTDLDLTLPSGDTSVDFALTAVDDGIFEPEENITLALPNADPGYAAVAPLSILLTIEKDLLTFSLWQDQNPGVDPALDADDDGDGWSTLLEYAMGTDPLDSNSAPDIDHVLTGTTLELNFPQAEERADLSIKGETSTDLLNWTEAGVTETGTGFSVDRNGPTRFMRLNLNLTATVIRS